MRMSVKVVALCSAVAVLGVACTSGGGSSNSTSPTSGGHLILGTTSNIDTLNPFVTFQQNSYAAFEYIYPQLVQYNSQTFEFKPDFAQSWDTSADGLTWTFHTVPNAKWSDGQPLTANDAAWTMNTILKYGDGPAGNLIGSLGFVKTVRGDGRQHPRRHVLHRGRERPAGAPRHLDPPATRVGAVRDG